MTPDEMWKAVCENDAAFDGLFFYAVESTGIFCRPSCKSKMPKRENVRFFSSAAQARAAGFRPCKRCRSDLADYQPIRETAEAAKHLLEASFADGKACAFPPRQLGLSRHRLSEIFQAVYGVTPADYVAGLRLSKAEQLLSTTDDPIVDIAYASGFGGLSSFYRFFKGRTGLSPAAYRKERQK
ncbi:MAG TPA: Ada metal-binding domain-containing protein [Clostridia bacterium]|nr:Ada metal-binding domain-containing protein [Clostridia bacterium]